LFRSTVLDTVYSFKQCSLRLRLACPLSHGDNLVAWWLTPKQARRRATFHHRYYILRNGIGSNSVSH